MSILGQRRRGGDEAATSSVQERHGRLLGGELKKANSSLASSISLSTAFPTFKMLVSRSLALAAAVGTASVLAQGAFKSQNSTFNSSAIIPPAAIAAANISALIANNAQVSLQFEQSNWATGSVGTDPFYTLPANASTAPAGALLKVEYNTTIEAFAVPPDTAMSRILFMTETVNGTAIPASAYVLWPYLPRTQPNGKYQTVAFAHGTTGVMGECAPSHIRPLQYQYGVTYALALQGYVVVAPDFAGLGVNQTANGTAIPLQYLASMAGANDIFYSVQAAQAAFPKLSREFAVVGHSEGGGVAWAVAERQAVRPVSGYLGTVAGSPVTNLTLLAGMAGPAGMDTPLIARGVSSIYPTFQLSEWLTEAGLKRLELAEQLQGCGAVTMELFANATLVLPDYEDNWYFNAWTKLASNGGKPISGPMLVLQGLADPSVPYKITDLAVNETCTLFPKSQIEYLTFADVTHSPSMWVSQRQWLGWIADRFANETAGIGCSVTHHTSAMPLANYLQNANWFIEYAVQSYETVDD